MKKWLVVVAVLALVAAGVFVSYQQGWIAPPALTVMVTAVAPDGGALPGVEVESEGTRLGETNANGQLTFEITRGIGEEISVSAKLDRPGFQFAPWEERVVVRKWVRSQPETMRYDLEAVLQPVAITSGIRVETEKGPAPGAVIQLDGKTLGKTDENGQLSMELGDRISRSGKLVVRLKGYKPFRDMATLRGDEIFDVSLSKVGVVYATLLTAYESLGRLVPVQGAEVLLAGKSIGTTDESGKLRFASPPRQSSVEVTRDGFLPEPAVVTVQRRSKRQVVVALYPKEAPVYRIAVLPPKNGKPGDRDVESALPEVEDRLSDYLFSYRCFRRVDGATFASRMAEAGISEEQLFSEGWEDTPLAGMADVVVATEVSKDNRLIVSLQVISAKGERLGAFAEIGKRSKVRSICENASEKIAEIFPFEGHVLGLENGRIVTSLGSGMDRDVKKNNRVAFFRATKTNPPELSPLGKAKVRKAHDDSSILEPEGDLADIQIGDKVVLLPRNKEASFNAAMGLTVKAGQEGSERPFADVNVYRDGTWVGLTSETGELRVPVASGDKHKFLFVRSGITPHREDLKVKGRFEDKVVVLPHTISRLRVESEPSGAQVTLDGRRVGITPLDIEVPMGFRRIKLDAGEEWRVFDKVLELTSIEENYTGARRFVMERDLLAQSEALLASGDVEGAIKLLSSVGGGHSDFSAAHNRLGGIYLDVKKQPERAVAEFEKVLERPENKQLVNKRFTVTFLNLGRAYYLTDTPEGAERAIPHLLTARDNKRFFPRADYDRASHDTLYFLALASHKLYYARPNERLLHETAQRWREYFDFFPASSRTTPRCSRPARELSTSTRRFSER